MSPPNDAPAEFSILGPLRVALDGVEVQITSRRQRALLVLLLMNVGRVVSTDRLIEQLWDGTPPPQATITLRSYVSNLRQALGGKEGLGGRLVTRGAGYSIEVAPELVDAVRLRDLAERGREHLHAGRAEEALRDFDAAVRLWAGDPLAEVADHEAAQSTLAQLTETYLGAVEGRFAALLETGRHGDAIPGLEGFVADHPLREEPRALLMLALYRSGRAPEALELYRGFRTLLADELGIDPSPRLDRLNTDILEQSPSLQAPERRRTAVPPAPPPGGGTEPMPGAGEVDASAAPRAGRLLVGRSRELGALRRRLEVLLGSGSGSLVLLAGEPGIGKTTLVEALEAQSRAGGAAVHSGRAPSATGAPAFWPWTQVLDSIAATLDDAELLAATAGGAQPVVQLSSSIATRTGRTAPLTGDNVQAMRFVLYEAVSAFIRQAGPERPTVITLDDLHWADLPSLELLSYLTPTLGSRPLMLVVTYRNLAADLTEGLSATLATVSREDGAEELALGGLDLEDVATLTAELMRDEPAETAPFPKDDLASVLHERTGGNPFFVRQLVRHLLDDDARTADPATAPVPPGVRHVIASRVNGLSAPARELVSAAAVIGRDFDLRTAAAAADMTVDEALDAFGEARAHGLVESSPHRDGARRFVHALVQEVAVELLPERRSAQLHAEVAAALGADPSAPPDALAEHLWAAREIVQADAVPALLAAADAAASLFSFEQAELHLRRALQLVRTTAADAQLELTILLSLFRLIATNRGWGDEDARELVDRATALSEGVALRDDTARLWWSVFFFLLDRDDVSGYESVARTLLRSIVGLDPCTGPVSEAASGGPYHRTEGPTHATFAAVHLMAIFERLAADDRESARDHLQRARAHVEESPPDTLAAYDEHLHVMLLLIEGYWSALHDDAGSYRTAISAATALADADGRPFPRAVARTLGSACLPYLSSAPEPEDMELMTQAGNLARHFGFGWLETLATVFTAWAAAVRGDDPDETAPAIEGFAAEVRTAGHFGNASISLLLRADLAALQGRTDEARSLLEEARATPGPYRGLVVEVLDRRITLLS